MLTQKFFTRVQLAKILDFKSDGSIKDFEKKGFLTPQIKPSKYTFNQVLFMMICKEIIHCTDLSWKDFINANFNSVLKHNLIDYNLLSLYLFKNANQPLIEVKKDDAIAKTLNDYLDGDLFYNVSELRLNANEYIQTFSVYIDKDYTSYLFSIDCINRKLHQKCIELKIDLKEKYSFKSISDNANSSIIDMELTG